MMAMPTWPRPPVMRIVVLSSDILFCMRSDRFSKRERKRRDWEQILASLDLKCLILLDCGAQHLANVGVRGKVGQGTVAIPDRYRDNFV